MTIEQIQARIDSGSTNARELINMIADYLQANPGGGGGLTLYSGDGTLAGDRVVDLDGHSLSFQEGGREFLKIGVGNPSLTIASLEAYHPTDGGNFAHVDFVAQPDVATFDFNSSFDDGKQEAHFFGDVNATTAVISLEASFNEGAKSVSIIGTADATTSTLTYTADTHAFVGVPEFADNASAITGGLAAGTIYRTGDLMKIVH